MNDDHDTIMAKVLAGDSLNTDEKAALKADGDLANVADFVHALKGIDWGEAPPVQLDDAILAHAKASVEKRRSPLVYVRLGLAAAAAFLIAMIILQLLPSPNAGTDRTAGTGDDTRGRTEVVTPKDIVAQTPKKRVVDKTPTTIPNFDWDTDEVDTELALLEAEFFLDNLNDGDAVLVENF